MKRSWQPHVEHPVVDAVAADGPSGRGGLSTATRCAGQRMKVVIDGRMIRYTGIGRYIHALHSALQKVAPGSDFLMLTNRGDAEAAGSSTGAGVNTTRMIPVYSLREQFLLPFDIRRQKADLVHYPSFNIPLVGTGPVVTTIHDIYYYLNRRACPGAVAYIYARLMLRRAARASTRIITVSSYARDEMVAHLGVDPARTAVIHNGVSPVYRPVEDLRKRAEVLLRYGIRGRYIFYAGSHHGRKNLGALVEAYMRIAGAHAVGLVIAGRKDDRLSRLYRRVEGSAVASRVRFTGEVPESDLPALYSGAEVFVFPTLYEGFGLPLLEAMASGTPVVTSDRASVPEVVGEAAVMVDPEDITALAGAITGVLQNPERAGDLRRLGLRRDALFTWEAAAEKTLAVYEDAMWGKR